MTEVKPLTDTTYFIAQGTYEDESVWIPDYIGTSRGSVERQIMAKAWKEGYRGSLDARMEELGWKIIECKIEGIRQADEGIE